MSIFGSWGGRYDEELSQKVNDLLAGKQSSQDKVNDFIEKDLGIDPSKLPFKPQDAKSRALALGHAHSAGGIEWQGNSLGLSRVVFYNLEDDLAPCPTCGGTDVTSGDGMEDNAGNIHSDPNELYCYDCEQQGNNPFYMPVEKDDNVLEEIRETDKHLDWNDLERIWKSLQPEFGTSFKCDVPHWGESQFEPIQHDINPDPTKLPTGTTVRLHKHVIDGDDEFVYAKIGGLFSDTDVCVLPSMKPIPADELQLWKVVEIL